MFTSSIVTAMDLIATFAFALVGARIAASKGMDYGGIALVAAVSSLSGGTFRNLFLGKSPAWLDHPLLFLAVVLAVSFTIVIRKTLPIGRFVLVLDTFGLAVATVSSVNFALSLHAQAVAAVILGLIGGVSGGLLRDVLCQVAPVLLHRETIGTSCFVGAALYVLIYQFSNSTWLLVSVSSLAVILVREFSIKYDLHLPKI